MQLPTRTSERKRRRRSFVERVPVGNDRPHTLDGSCASVIRANPKGRPSTIQLTAQVRLVWRSCRIHVDKTEFTKIQRKCKRFRRREMRASYIIAVETLIYVININ